MRVAFVHNFCTHYTRPTFELLSRLVPIDFYFYSGGEEWYWQTECAPTSGKFNHEYLDGFSFGRTRVTPSLISRLLFTSYDAYIKCINGKFALPLTYMIARLKRKPFILRTGIWMKIQTPLHRLIYPATRFIYRHADAIVVYGEHTKRFLVTEGVEPARVFVAPHAVENERYSRLVSSLEQAQLRKQLAIAQDQKVILHVGRLEEVKGVKYLLESFSRMSDRTSVLVIVGSGSERQSLESLATNLGLGPRVRFVGHVSPAETIKYFSIAFCLVLASITTPTGNELWGLVVNEAFNQGVPVVATTAVGAAAAGLVVDQVNGFVVPERDAATLASRLDQLLSDGALRDRLSAAAKREIQEWTPQRMAEAFRDAIYFSLGQDPSKSPERYETPPTDKQYSEMESRV